VEADNEHDGKEDQLVPWRGPHQQTYDNTSNNVPLVFQTSNKKFTENSVKMVVVCDRAIIFVVLWNIIKLMPKLWNIISNL
jgi:hypothetical protein